MILKLGIMQGRLLPKQNDFYQCHPENWQKEFELCKKYKFNAIEWIIDKNSEKTNPIISHEGRTEILKYVKKYNIFVETICADILMEKNVNKEFEFKEWCILFEKIIAFSSLLKIKVIVLPLIERMSLKNKKLYKLIVDKLNEVVPVLKEKSLKIALELDLHPKGVKKLLTKLNTRFIGINYDIGNSASLGYDIKEEFSSYGKNIFDIHVKDRNLGKGPCLLGTGNADFKTAVKLIKEYKLDCPIIMQAYRNFSGLEITVLQRDWFEKIFNDDFKV